MKVCFLVIAMTLSAACNRADSLDDMLLAADAASPDSTPARFDMGRPDIGMSTDLLPADLLSSGDGPSPCPVIPPLQWAIQPTGTTKDLHSVWGSSSSDVIAVGNNGTVLHTVNSGKNWAMQASGTVANLYGVWGSSATDVFAVGAGGVIVHSGDGLSWNVKASGVNNTLWGIWGTGVGDVFVVGNGLSLHSGDSGGTWSVFGNPFSLTAVWGTAHNDLYASDLSGKVVHSADGGMSWVTLVMVPTGPLYSIWGGENSIYVAGEKLQSAEGVIAETTNSGMTWGLFAPGNVPGLHGLWGSGSCDVFTVGGGTILHTSDRGTTWQQQANGAMTVLEGVWGSNGSVYTVGGLGIVLFGH